MAIKLYTISFIFLFLNIVLALRSNVICIAINYKNFLASTIKLKFDFSKTVRTNYYNQYPIVN